MARINALEPEYEALSDDQLRDKTTEFRGRYLAGESLDEPAARGLRRRAGGRAADAGPAPLRRAAHRRHGAARGQDRRDADGRGQDARGDAPGCTSNALAGKGVHVVTVNDYLASATRSGWPGVRAARAARRRDPARHGARACARRPTRRTSPTARTTSSASTTCATTWSGTCRTACSGGLHYAIVDEIDNILIDEARTPLIISGPAEEVDRASTRALRASCRGSKPRGRLHIEEKHRADQPHRRGHRQGGALARRSTNLYDAENYRADPLPGPGAEGAVHLQARRDYVVKDGEVVIVDEFTGRLMTGRRYQRGPAPGDRGQGRRAGPARERHAGARSRSRTTSASTSKLAGMTGTAATEARRVPQDLQPGRRRRSRRTGR